MIFIQEYYLKNSFTITRLFDWLLMIFFSVCRLKPLFLPSFLVFFICWRSLLLLANSKCEVKSLAPSLEKSTFRVIQFPHLNNFTSFTSKFVDQRRMCMFTTDDWDFKKVSWDGKNFQCSVYQKATLWSALKVFYYDEWCCTWGEESIFSAQLVPGAFQWLVGNVVVGWRIEWRGVKSSSYYS